MNVQDAKSLTIPEGGVKTIHDKNNCLLWGAVGYDTKYEGDTTQQTYTGKNLFQAPSTAYDTIRATYTKITDNSFTIATTETANWCRAALSITGLQQNTNYTISGVYTNTGSITNNYLVVLTTGGTSIKEAYVNSTTSLTFNTGANTDVIIRIFASVGAAIDNMLTVTNFQLESGSTATSYEPYCGSIPSPNPDYPQDVNVVTGTQTITISDGTLSEDFTVGLGSTELCKIGTYQDYIYKSGDDWYAHKEIAQYSFTGDETWGGLSQILTNTSHFTIADYTTVLSGAYVPPNDSTVGYGISNRFVEKANLYNVDQIGMDFHANKNLIVSIPNSMGISTASNWATWLKTNPTSIYYVLASATDTQITDATLISQLNAIHEWLTRYGYNATISGNLPIIIDRTNL